MTVYFSDLDDYGRGVDINSLLQKYRLFFEKAFTVEQIIHALHRHCETSAVIPKVVDLKKILDPEPLRITEAEFIEAQQWQARNGYPLFSDAKETIDAYKAQQAEKRHDHKNQSEQILAIAKSSVKMIEG